MNKTAKKYVTKRAHVSRENNKGVVILCKTITFKLLIIVGLIIEYIIFISKPKEYLETSLPVFQNF